MSWNYENPKTREEALDLMSSAYGITTCSMASTIIDDITYCYDPSCGWTGGPKNSIYIPPEEILKEVFDTLFEELKTWWATQLNVINNL